MLDSYAAVFGARIFSETKESEVKKKISDVEAFKRESDAARKLRPTPEQVNHLNELIREAALEEEEIERKLRAKVARKTDPSVDSQF
jgi:hypothetical protein